MGNHRAQLSVFLTVYVTGLSDLRHFCGGASVMDFSGSLSPVNMVGGGANFLMFFLRCLQVVGRDGERQCSLASLDGTSSLPAC